MARKCRNRCLPPHRRGVLTILLPLGPGGPPAKVLVPSVYRPAIALLLGKKETPRPPLIEERRRLLPSVRAPWPASSPTSCAAAWPTAAIAPSGAYPCNMIGRVLGRPNLLAADHAWGQVCARRPAPLSCDMTHGLTT